MRTLGTLVLVVGLLGCDSEEDGTGGAGGGSSKASTGVSSSASTSGSTSVSVTTGGGTSELFKSGTRLRVRKLVAPDGSEQQIGFQDTQLDTPCMFARAEDDTTRCLPIGDGELAVSAFSDAACTKPLVRASCGIVPKFVAVQTPETCASASVTILPVVGPHAGAVYSTKTAVCALDPAPEALYDAGPAMAPGAFVAATETVE